MTKRKDMDKRVKKRLREYEKDKWNGTKTSGIRKREREVYGK